MDTQRLEDIVNTKVDEMRYVITSAQYGASVNDKVFDTLKYYADYNKAELIVLPLQGYMVDESEGLDEQVEDYVLYKNKKLNNNVNVAHFGVRAQTIQPMTSVARFAQKDGTTIFASPKQSLEGSSK